MNEIEHIVTFLIVVAVVYSLFFGGIGFAIGYHARGSYNQKELKEVAKQEFTKAVAWAINEEVLIVNSNKLYKIEEMQKRSALGNPSDSATNSISLENTENVP